MPAIAGLLHPHLLLPADFSEWPAGRRRAVLLHEVAHARRYDCLTRFLAQLICAAFWWQPLVWFAAWRARIAQEHAADDAVLRAGERHSDYAAHLVDVARLRAVPVALAMAQRSTLPSRVKAILGGRISRRALAAPQLAAIALLLVAVALAIGALHPAQAAPQTPPPPSPVKIAPGSLYKQAVAAHMKHHTVEAEQLYIEELDRLRATQPDPEQMIQIATMLAILTESESRSADAERWYKEAIAGSDNKALGLALDCYAAFLKRQDRAAEAVSLDERAKLLRHHRAATLAVQNKTPIYKVGGSVAAPKLTYKVEPEYSDVARVLKIAGTVVLYAEIVPEGRARNIRVVRPLGFGLDEAAMEALSNWKFRPGAKDGQPVTVSATIEVNFRLL